MRPQRGFTLVEILVVVVIIGILAVGAVLSMSFLGADRQIGAEGDRIAALINYAQDQAGLQTRELGLYCVRGGYRFLAYDPRSNRWLPVGNDDALRERALPDGLRFELNVDGQDVTLKEEMPPAPAPAGYGSAPTASDLAAAPASSSAPDAQALLQPQIMIFSNGDLSMFRIRLLREGSDRTVLVSSDSQGRATASEPGDAT